MSIASGDLMATVVWHANPFRGDKFEDAWRPVAAAAIDYGASWWALLRSKADPLDFLQMAIFADEDLWERYWLSEQVSEARAGASGLFQVPVLPFFQRVAGFGEVRNGPGEVAA